MPHCCTWADDIQKTALLAQLHGLKWYSSICNQPINLKWRGVLKDCAIFVEKVRQAGLLLWHRLKDFLYSQRTFPIQRHFLCADQWPMVTDHACDRTKREMDQNATLLWHSGMWCGSMHQTSSFPRLAFRLSTRASPGLVWSGHWASEVVGDDPAHTNYSENAPKMRNTIEEKSCNWRTIKCCLSTFSVIFVSIWFANF